MAGTYTALTKATQSEPKGSQSPRPDLSTRPQTLTTPAAPFQEQTALTKEISEKRRDTAIPRHHRTMTPRYHDAIIEAVRVAVKEFGKEAATHRFTLEEKKAIANLVYTYKLLGVKTSENEIARIAINFLLADYREKGERSILHQTLKALNS